MPLSEDEKLQKLNEFTKTEWYDVAKHLVPDLTPEEYDIMWDEFVEMKRMKGLN